MKTPLMTVKVGGTGAGLRFGADDDKITRTVTTRI